MTARKIYLNGHTCLSCGEYFYDGYDVVGGKTTPCKKCGHQAPARMLPSEYKKAVLLRDAKP